MEEIDALIQPGRNSNKESDIGMKTSVLLAKMAIQRPEPTMAMKEDEGTPTQYMASPIPTTELIHEAAERLRQSPRPTTRAR